MVKGFNTYDNECARTIKAQCGKNSLANYTRTDSFGATGAIAGVAKIWITE